MFNTIQERTDLGEAVYSMYGSNCVL